MVDAVAKGRVTTVGLDLADDAAEEPAQGPVARIGSMIKQLLDEVRQAPLDDASRERLREIYDRSINELADGLSQIGRAHV